MWLNARSCCVLLGFPSRITVCRQLELHLCTRLPVAPLATAVYLICECVRFRTRETNARVSEESSQASVGSNACFSIGLRESCQFCHPPRGCEHCDRCLWTHSLCTREWVGSCGARRHPNRAGSLFIAWRDSGGWLAKTRILEHKLQRLAEQERWTMPLNFRRRFRWEPSGVSSCFWLNFKIIIDLHHAAAQC